MQNSTSEIDVRRKLRTTITSLLKLTEESEEKGISPQARMAAIQSLKGLTAALESGGP